MKFDIKTKLKMKMGNASKRQQPDLRAENSQPSPMGLQHSDKIPHPKADLRWPHVDGSKLLVDRYL